MKRMTFIVSITFLGVCPPALGMQAEDSNATDLLLTLRGLKEQIEQQEPSGERRGHHLRMHSKVEEAKGGIKNWVSHIKHHHKDIAAHHKKDLKILKQHVNAFQIHEAGLVNSTPHAEHEGISESGHDDHVVPAIPIVATTVLQASSTFASAITIIEAVNESLGQQLKEAQVKGDTATLTTIKYELNMVHSVVACLALVIGGGYYWGYFNFGDVSTLPGFLKEVFF